MSAPIEEIPVPPPTAAADTDDVTRTAAATSADPPELADAPADSPADTDPVTVGSDAPATANSTVGDPESGETPVDSAARPRRWAIPLVIAGLAVLLAVSTAFAAVYGWKLGDRDDTAAAGSAAMAAAQQYAVALTSIDSGRIDKDFAAVRDGATGSFRDTYMQSADHLKPLLIQAKSVSKGQVVGAGIQSASKDHVVVVLFVDAAITNVTSPQPRTDRNRLVMTMDRIGGRWLASKVDLI